MKRNFGILLCIASAALFIVAGYGLLSPHHQRDLLSSLAGPLSGPSVACAHTGGDCYLDDSNLATVEGKCYSKCSSGFKVPLEARACEVGCSMSIDVATKRK